MGYWSLSFWVILWCLTFWYQLATRFSKNSKPIANLDNWLNSISIKQENIQGIPWVSVGDIEEESKVAFGEWNVSAAIIHKEI